MWDPLYWIAMDQNSQTWLLNLKAKDGLCSDCTVIAGQAMLTHPDGSKITTKDGIFVHQ
jgi:hypothetical protein